MLNRFTKANDAMKYLSIGVSFCWRGEMKLYMKGLTFNIDFRLFITCLKQKELETGN